jgi:hypothetical protein
MSEFISFIGKLLEDSPGNKLSQMDKSISVAYIFLVIIVTANSQPFIDCYKPARYSAQVISDYCSKGDILHTSSVTSIANEPFCTYHQ